MLALVSVAGGSGADYPKVSEMQKSIEVLQSEKAESSQKINELEGEIKDISQRLTSAENDRDILKKEHEQLIVEKQRILEDYKTLQVEFGRLASCAEKPVELAAGGETVPSALREEVLRLRQALAGITRLALPSTWPFSASQVFQRPTLKH